MEEQGSVNLYRVLLVGLEQALFKRLKSNVEDIELFWVSQLEEASEFLQKQYVNLVLFTFDPTHSDPVQVVNEIVKVSPHSEIIMSIEDGREDLALEFIQHGVSDVVEEPLELSKIEFLLRKCKLHGSRKLILNTSELSQRGFAGIIGASSKMQSIFSTLQRIVNFDTTVLVRGESGTGKELVARACHEQSSRKHKAFVPINCGAIPEHLIESELFGHRKGSFTDAISDKAGLFEVAHGGTIFLDEIGELSMSLQVKLLRVLQEKQINPIGASEPKTVNVRVIAATHRNLDQAVSSGAFREDLYYRLNVISIEIPALRERMEDLELLIDHFLAKYSRSLNVLKPLLTDAALAMLRCYSWPGNVRELENCIERALVLHSDKTIDTEHLPEKINSNISDIKSVYSLGHDNLSIKEHVRYIEQDLIRKALERTRGNRTHAAKLLEISHRSLLYKLKDYELEQVGKNV